jgi:hypothetical protein
MIGRRSMRTPDGVRMILFRSSERWVRLVRLGVQFNFLVTHVHASPLQTENYQIAGGDGPTHGTDGPLNVSLASDDIGEQFLQVGRAYDPARARPPPSDVDTNDLSTINVYTVGVLFLPHILNSATDCCNASSLRGHWMNPAGSEMAQVRCADRCAW